MFCGAFWAHTFQNGAIVQKRLKTAVRLYGKIYFCVIESKQNYRPANSEKNVDFDSSKSSEYTPTSTKSGIKNENILH